MPSLGDNRDHLMEIETLHRQFPLDARLIQSESVSVEKIPCCWILTKAGEDRKIKLNDSSMLIWQLCEAGNTVGEIISVLRESFPEADDIDKDIHRALDELEEEGLVSVA